MLALEDEVRRLQESHEEAKDIFSLLDKWQHLWTTLAELESCANDPARWGMAGVFVDDDLV